MPAKVKRPPASTASQRRAPRLRAATGARHSLQTLAAFAELCSDGVLAFDDQGRYTLWSGVLERLSGVRDVEVLGKSAQEVFPVVTPLGSERLVQEALAGRTAASPGGQRFDVRYAPLYDARQKVVGGFAVVRLAAPAARAFFAQVLEHMAEGVLVVDEHGVIVYANAAEERMLGYGGGELSGRRLFELGAAAPKPAPGTAWEGELSFRRRDGSACWALARRFHWEVDGQRYLLSIDEDLTRRKQAQADLKRAIGARDEFLSIASHELNTPLTSVTLHVQALQRALRNEGPVSADELSPRLLQVRRQLQRLATLVRELLDLSRIEGGKLRLAAEPVDAAEVLRALLLRDAEDFARACCEVQLTAPSSLVGLFDPGRLEQVFDNLLSNARKYGAGKPIEVRLEQARERLVLRVRDHGIGIAPEAQRRIFERFERAVSERHYGGFGLGLWIVRRVALACGGDIQVESSPGKGATFELQLPLAPALSPPPEG